MKQRFLVKKAAALFLSACLAFGSMPVSAQSVGAVEEQMQIFGLTTEYLTNPIGVEEESVHFAWKMKSNRIGAKQTAYQILVTEGAQSVWDSGKVESTKSTGIVCEAQLQEGTQYQWTVTVWDDKGETFTEHASFETGVSNQQEWKDAAFIRLNASPTAPVFRTEQQLEAKEISKARLYITALGVYEAYVNGSRVGEYAENREIVYHHLNPGYGNVDVSLGYQTYDVTSFLTGGQAAVVAVKAGTGWKNGMASTTARPAVKALLRVVYSDGTVQNIQTNTRDWKGTLEGGITKNGIYYGEDYNAIFEKELAGYAQPGYDDSKWVNAVTVEEDPDRDTCIKNNFDPKQAAYARILVKETGPADNNRENLLQIMEMELLDVEGKNVASGIVPQISNSWSPNGQWKPEHLTDGDLGNDTDNGYTSTVLGKGQETFVLGEPISMTFQLKEAASLAGLRIYPRTSVESISGYQCANYPKKYCLQVSDDGTTWTTVNLSGGAGAAETVTTAGWTEQTEANAHVVENLRNYRLHPEVTAFSIGTEFDKVSAKHVKVSVSETGPAVAEDHENRMQIMEMELLDGEVNVSSGVTPTVSDNTLSGIAQWNAANLTDGDYGISEDRGYSTDIFGTDEQFGKPQQPVTIQFDFPQAVQLSGIKFYPRVAKDSISYGVCANYPKVYTIEVSDDGVNWNTVLADFDQGIVRNATLYENTEMSETTFAGEIRAQNAIPVKFAENFDQYPVAAYTYSGLKAASDYAGGEIQIDASYDSVPGQNIFGEGIELKKGQKLIVNMGQNLSAVPRIEFSGRQGARATLNFAEMLNDGSSVGNGATQADGPKGSIYQKSLRGARSAATYVFSGDGRETYQPSMSYFGYQYVQVTASDDITVYSLCSKALSSVTKQTGSIQTNNQNVNQLFSNVLYGQLSNYFTTPTDCNQRDERLSWSGDTQAFAQTAVYNFDSAAFLNEMQKIYNENTWIKGYVPGVADNINGFFQGWAAGWSDVLIIVPWVLYQQTGDASFLKDNWETLVHYMDYMKSRERGTNQAPAEGSMNYGDWLSFQGTSVEVINDYYYGYMHQIMAKMANIVGDTQKASEYSQKFEAIKETFLKTHVTFEDGNLVIKSKEGNRNLQFQNGSGKEGVWENNSQTSLLWMLKLGFYDSEQMRQAAETLLVENIKNENPAADSVRAGYGKNTLAVGFLGSNVIAPVLSEVGHADVSYDLLLQEEQPSWLFEVLAGATTVWERWNSYTPGTGFGHSEMNSFNHYAYGSVLEWMYRYMAGISADEENPGFQHIILQPMPDTGKKYNNQERILTADGSYESYYGTIQSAWHSDGQKLTAYHTEIPANTTATLYLPVEQELAVGTKLPAGAKYQGMELHNGLNCATFSLPSGGYDFKLNGEKLEVSIGDGYQGEYSGGNEEPDTTVKSVTVNPKEKELLVGETLQLKATVLPAEANQDVTYRSGDDSIAEVNTSGKVTAKQEGKVDITISCKANPQVKTICKITVKKKDGNEPENPGDKPENPGDKPEEPGDKPNNPEPIPVASLTVNPAKKVIFLGKTYRLKIRVLPVNAQNKELIYTSADDSIAEVNAFGKITAKKVGKTTITVASKENPQIKDTCQVTVAATGNNLLVEGIELRPTKKELFVGENLQLIATVLPAEAKNKEVQFTSEDSSIAEVNVTGKVTAKKEGTVKITAASKENPKISATCQITVKKIPVKSLTLKKKPKPLSVGETFRFVPTVVPANATDKQVNFHSSNSKVVKIDASGKATALKQGKAYITITSKSNKKAKIKCKITVKKPSIQISGASKVKRGKKIKLRVSIKNIKGTVKWSVNNKKMATIKGKGKTATLKAKKKTGIVKVTVQAANIKKTKKIRIIK